MAKIKTEGVFGNILVLLRRDHIAEIPGIFLDACQSNRGVMDPQGRDDDIFILDDGRIKDGESGFIQMDKGGCFGIFVKDGQVFDGEPFDQIKVDAP